MVFARYFELISEDHLAYKIPIKYLNRKVEESINKAQNDTPKTEDPAVHVRRTNKGRTIPEVM